MDAFLRGQGRAGDPSDATPHRRATAAQLVTQGRSSRHPMPLLGNNNNRQPAQYCARVHVPTRTCTCSSSSSGSSLPLRLPSFSSGRHPPTRAHLVVAQLVVCRTQQQQQVGAAVPRSKQLHRWHGQEGLRCTSRTRIQAGCLPCSQLHRTSSCCGCTAAVCNPPPLTHRLAELHGARMVAALISRRCFCQPLIHCRGRQRGRC